MHSSFIMVAPNGAYKSKQDHKNVPITVSETVATAVACYNVGAHGLHAHVRNAHGEHCLDAGLYQELIQELTRVAPGLLVQITTEAVGRYSPQAQRDVVRAVKPKAVSVAIKEMLSDKDHTAIRKFYHEAAEHSIDLQHILYSKDDVLWLDKLINDGVIPQSLNSTLFVLGRYSDGQRSSPIDLPPFLAAKAQSVNLKDAPYMVCAFGPQEIDCLVAANKTGGDCRIGFENNLYTVDNLPATNNQERVQALCDALK